MVSQMKNIKIIGNIAQTMAVEDFHRHGFITFESMRAGYDFVGILLDTQKRIVQILFVEVKKVVGPGKVRISKVQQNFRKICKLTHFDHIIYHVTTDQMEYWLENKKTVTLDNFINSKDGVI